MLDTLFTSPMSDTLTMRAALRATRRVRAIAASREFDDDAVRLLMERVEHELEEASVAADLCVPEEYGIDATPQTRGCIKKAA
jgi:hypothetical protein